MNNPRSKRLLPPNPTARPGWPRITQPARSSDTGRGQRTVVASAGSFVQGEALFLASLSVIDDMTAQVCRRHRLSGPEADDFRSEVRLHFLDRDYEVLRKFEGRCSLPTYINVVVQRLFLDYRNRQWGKWRPSAEANRLGPTAILVDRLVSRDGWSVEQAVELLRVNHGVTLDETLEALFVKLARRSPSRQFVAEHVAEEISSPGPGSDVNVVRAEQDFLAKRVQSALDRARQALDPEDRLILKMRFEDAVPVADIARALHLDQKRLYRSIERLLARIGASLEAEGISRADVSALFADGSLGWLRDEAGSSAPTGRGRFMRLSWLKR
jgi:RNA polymerase sigma factor (sigma-70 family)